MVDSTPYVDGNGLLESSICAGGHAGATRVRGRRSAPHGRLDPVQERGEFVRYQTIPSGIVQSGLQ
jgi:hypothetical protein